LTLPVIWIAYICNQLFIHQHILPAVSSEQESCAQKSPESSIKLLGCSASCQVDGMLTGWRPGNIRSPVNLLQLHCLHRHSTISNMKRLDSIIIIQYKKVARYQRLLWLWLAHYVMQLLTVCLKTAGHRKTPQKNHRTHKWPLQNDFCKPSMSTKHINSTIFPIIYQ